MLFTFEVSNPLFWKPWHFPTAYGHAVGWLWFAFAVYNIPPGTNSFVAQQKQPTGNVDA